MAELGHTLLLSDDWDLMLDSGGNIRTATGAYGIAQNVANRVRLFTNDAYYNWRWEGPLGTPLGLVHWKRASSPVEAGTSGFL